MDMAKTENTNFYLPDGLPLEPIDPQWLSTNWPMDGLTSSISSVIIVGAIFLGLAVVCFLLALACKTFLPNWLKSFGKLVFILAGAGSIAAAGLSGFSWSQPNNISDHSMGVEVTRTTDWLRSQNVSADNRAVWDLICFYYDDRNKNCQENHPQVYYKGNPEKVRLEKQKDGTVILYDYENLSPLIN